MISFKLRKLLGDLEKKTGRRITLKEVAERSGCDKNALSRIVNHPEVAPSATVIDKLVQYFFREFKLFDQKKREDDLMKEIIQDFVSVIPDDFDYHELIPEQMKGDLEHLSLETIWGVYNQIKYGASVVEVPKEQSWTNRAAPSEATKSKDSKKRAANRKKS